MSLKLTQEYAESVVNNRVDTNKLQVEPFVYIGTEMTKLICTCAVCTYIWNPSYHNFTTGNTQECPACRATKMGTEYSLSLDEINKRVLSMSSKLLIHPFIYINQKTQIAYTCKTCGCQGKAALRKHTLSCPACASYGFDPTKNATLYYLKVTDDTTVTYKIGITNRTIQERFTSTDLEKIQVLGSWEFRVGSDAYKEEQAILSQYREYKYSGIPILSSGNTELFTFDILGLDLV